MTVVKQTVFQAQEAINSYGNYSAETAAILDALLGHRPVTSDNKKEHRERLIRVTRNNIRLNLANAHQQF